MAKILPRTMRAVGLYKYLPIADPSSLVDVEVNLPTLQKKDILVQVKAVSVNPIDTKLRAPKPTVETQPRILGFDGAGIVVNNGQEADIYKPGDEVFFTGDIRRNGSNAQYVAINEMVVGPKPKTLTFEQAAAMPLISLTAYEQLIDRMLISEKDEGKTLLIINSAGGVGSVASQLAKNMGLKVIGTASRPETEAFSRDHGADIVLNHTTDLIPQLEASGHGSGVDFILVNYDPYPYWDTLMKAVKPQGTIGLIVEGSGAVDLGPLKDKSVRLASGSIISRAKYETERFRQHEILKEVSKLIDSGVLKCSLTKTLSPINAANLREAHRLIEEQKMIGKLVLTGF